MEPIAIYSRTLLGCVVIASCSCTGLGWKDLPRFRLSSVSGDAEMTLPERSGKSGFFSSFYDRDEYPQIRFREQGFGVDPAMDGVLKEVAERVVRENRTLLLAGFAVGTPSPGHGRVVSERLALEVRAKLVSQGVKASSISTVGFGDDFSNRGDHPGRWVTVGVGPVEVSEKMEGEDE